MRSLFRPFVATLALVLAACGGGSEPPASDLAGTWALTTSVVGSSLVISLSPQGTTVTGTGHVSIEAGFQGAVDVTGTVQNRNVMLTLHYGDGTVLAFNGNLVSPTEMDGTFTSPAGDSFAQFLRQGG